MFGVDKVTNRPLLISKFENFVIKSFSDTVDGVAYQAIERIEPQTRKIFMQNVRKSDIVFDIGAQYGLYTLLASKLAYDGLVYAFEPEDDNFYLLVMNVSDNKCSNVYVKKLLIDKESGKKELIVYRGSDSHSLYLHPRQPIRCRISVSSMSIDDFVKEENVYPDFLKIDAEGNEYNVLLGASELLSRKKDLRMIVEFEPDYLMRANVEPDELIRLIMTYGFRIFVIDELVGSVYSYTDDFLEQTRNGIWKCNLFCYR